MSESNEFKQIEELVNHKAVLNAESNRGYFILRVQPYGNARFFSKLLEYPHGNISTYDNGDLKVNIRHTS